MVATIVIAALLAIYLVLFLFFEIRRRKKGKGSLFTEDYCDCKTMTGKRLIAAYKKAEKKRKKAEL